MKFMKRKKEMLQNEEKRKAAAAAVAAASNGTYSPSPASRQHHPQDSTAMEVDDPVDRTADQQFNINNHPSHYGQVVTSVDMYGMQAALIGRRSFGGFNPAMERAYSESKASVENRATSDRPQQKISDEELLERYKEIAMQRDGGGDGRGVGNLDTKVKKRKRQGLR
jgi:M-phase phosphoprotein 6